jgi:hypothetical protein
MPKYAMTCSCGDSLQVDAASRDEAVTKIQGLMTLGYVETHMAQKHPGEPRPNLGQIHGMVAQGVQVA